jgi:hypothetical protein
VNKLSMFCLIAFFAAPAHAQVCSGGASGGMDATGNECSDTDTIRAYVDGSNIASSGPTAKMSGIERSMVVKVATRPSVKTSAVPAASRLSTYGVSRIAKAPPSPSEPVKTAKIDTSVSASCSGGGDGGMDATGNQCNETRPPVNAPLVVAAKP